MEESFDGQAFEALPPYPGVLPPYTSPSGTPVAGSFGGVEHPPAMVQRRGWLGAALAIGAVGLAAAAFLLGRGTAHSSTVPTATALRALGQATTPSTPVCNGPRRIAAGTLRSVSGDTLTLSNPKGGTVTVHTTASTKIVKVVKGSITDVTTGAVVSVHGNASGTSIAADEVAVLPKGTANALRPFVGGQGPMAGSMPLRGLPEGIAIGTVENVSGSTFTVTVGGTTVTVTTTSSTAFSKSAETTVSGLTIGQPISVIGTPNSDGSINAANIDQAGANGELGPLGPLGPGFRFGHGPRGGPGGPGGPDGPMGGPGSGTVPPGTTPPTTG